MDKFLHNLKKTDDYDDCLTTLKETSYDKQNNEYLCHSDFPAYDFDCITDKLYHPNKKPRSFDALIVLESRLYCIEFKNQLPSKIVNSEIQEKLQDSQETLRELFTKYNIQKNDYDFVFFVVYKKSEGRSDFGRLNNHLNETENKFNLEKKLKTYFKKNNIITHDIEFLCQKYSNKLKTQKNT